jgi:hypothetical protein
LICLLAAAACFLNLLAWFLGCCSSETSSFHADCRKCKVVTSLATSLFFVVFFIVVACLFTHELLLLGGVCAFCRSSVVFFNLARGDCKHSRLNFEEVLAVCVRVRGSLAKHIGLEHQEPNPESRRWIPVIVWSHNGL